MERNGSRGPKFPAKPPQNLPDPLVKENATVKVSGHAYVIPDGNVVLVPNIGIVVGQDQSQIPRGDVAGTAVDRKIEAQPMAYRSSEACLSVAGHLHPGDAAPCVATLPRRLGQSDLTPGLAAIREHEAARGLDRWSRVAMRYELS